MNFLAKMNFFPDRLRFVQDTHGNSIGTGVILFCVQKMGIPGTGIYEWEVWIHIFWSHTKGWCCYLASYSKQNNQNTSNHGFGKYQSTNKSFNAMGWRSQLGQPPWLSQLSSTLLVGGV